MNRSNCLTIFLVAAASAIPLQAQMIPGLQAMMIDVQHQSTMRQVFANSEEQVREPSDVSSLVPSAGRTSASTLTFESSSTRRRANYAQFVQRSRSADPAGADGLAETLKSDPIALMGPELSKVGLRTNNVADAYTVYWVEAWQAVHGVSGASSRATAQAVRQQAANAINATPEFASATPAQKQEFADSLLVQALLVGAAKEQAQGDPAKLAKVSAAVEQGARAMGLDLRAMMLTEAGFESAKKIGATKLVPETGSKSLATNEANSQPSFGVLAVAGGAGLGAAFLLGKAIGRKG